LISHDLFAPACFARHFSNLRGKAARACFARHFSNLRGKAARACFARHFSNLRGKAARAAVTFADHALVKIAIFGAGAIGGYLGARLHQAGAEISLVARGPHLEAMKANGLTLHSAGASVTLHPFCTGDVRELGPQDYVIVTLKAYALPAAAPDIAALLGANGTLVTASNGIPYWYFHAHESRWRDRVVAGVDPGGVLWRTLQPQQVLGCALYPSGEVVAPGVVAHSYGTRVILGEPDGTMSRRVEALSHVLTEAGLEAPVSRRIRDDIWLKLWGNLAFNPLSVLTGATLDRLATQPELRAAARAMMVEAQDVAEKLGVRFAMDVERRIDATADVGAHRTSMLQDFEKKRPLELDAMLGAVVELGTLTGDAMPFCRAILALARERAGQTAARADVRAEKA
jgi:2-dehydropantoate 2-reductase